jgi:colanic acid/amylovoran biosynthesis glycosyltransferase
MKLAVFTHQFPGPGSTFFARDMRGLIEAGIEVEVFPIYPLDTTLWRHVPDTLNEKILSRSKVHHLTLGQSLRVGKVRHSKKLGHFMRDILPIIGSAARFGVGPFSKTGYAFLKAFAWVQQFPHQFDHILAYWGNYAATCAYTYHRLMGRQIPFSLFVHAGIDLYRTPIFMRQKLLYADNIITCSNFNREFIGNAFPDIWPGISSKIHVHQHGLDLSEFSFEPNSRPACKIIAVGRLARYKGFDFLLRAIHELKNRGLCVDVELVGDGEEAGALKALANTLGISEAVHFRGWLTSREVCSAMKQATILVHPSPYLADGVPNVIKEAMAVGTPVIASNVAGIPELIVHRKGGLLVPPKDVRALSKASELLLLDPIMQQEYSQAAREHAEEHFDMWRNGKHLAQVLCSTKVRKSV